MDKCFVGWLSVGQETIVMALMMITTNPPTPRALCIGPQRITALNYSVWLTKLMHRVCYKNTVTAWALSIRYPVEKIYDYFDKIISLICSKWSLLFHYG